MTIDQKQTETGTSKKSGAISISSTASKMLLLGAFGVLLYVAHAAFIPVALALLFALILSGPVEALHKWHVPRSVSALFILIITLGLIAGIVDVMWAPAQQWLAKAPRTMVTVRHKIHPVSRFMGNLDDLRKNAGNIATTSPATSAAQTPVVATPQTTPATLLDVTREVVVSIVTCLIVTLFLLAGGHPMLARMTAAFVNDLNATHVLNLLEKVRVEVGRFYVTTMLINLGLGCATAAVMQAWGMPNPVLWGVLAAILNFIPYAGSATTLIVVTLVAFVSFDTLGQVLGVAGSYLALATIEGQIVQPLLVGRRLQVNPLLVFLALWFGGLFWGIPGIVLATPMLVALKVIAQHTNNRQAMMEFLGPNDQSPDRDQKLQRLVRRKSS